MLLTKRFWWLSMLLAGLLAMGFLVGCEETDDDDDDDSGTPIPESFHGWWFTVGAQVEGDAEIYPAEGMIKILISSSGTRATFYVNDNEMASGSAVWQDGTTDHIVLKDSERELNIDIEVSNVDGNWATFKVPFETGDEYYHMIKDGGRVAGLVYDYETDLPLENATVTLTSSLDNSLFGTTQTNAFGLYEFSGVSEIYYTAEVSLNGYASQSDPVDADEDAVRYQDFALETGDPTGTVSGLISDAATMLAPEVPVRISIDGIFQLESSDGSYIIRDVELGSRSLTASADGYEPYTAMIDVAEGVNVQNINLIAVEVGEGTITGVVNDSQEAMPLEGVLVSSDDGATTYTDAAGAYSITVESGARTISLSLDGYYNSYFDIFVENEGSHTNNPVMTPNLGGGEGEMRFVLTWGVSPSDLDSYLETPEIGGTEYTIYYSNTGSETAAPYATLDRDDMSSYGPETITIFQLQSGTYRYMIHNYSGSPDIAGSEATVQIYSEEGLINTVTVPATGEGRWWYVGDVDGATGNVTVVNTVGDRPEFAPSLLPAKISD